MPKCRDNRQARKRRKARDERRQWRDLIRWVKDFPKGKVVTMICHDADLVSSNPNYVGQIQSFIAERYGVMISEGRNP
jgi:hypothetical protein